MNPYFRKAPSILALLTAPLVLTQVPAPRADYEAKADAIVKSYANDGLFQGSVLVKYRDTILFQRSYGMANVEWGRAFTAKTRFRIGSMTKQFAAVAILQLEEQGKLSVQDSVRKYYPEAPAEWEAITIEHLLRHSSGIYNYTDQAGFDFRKARTAAEVVELTHSQPLGFAPGSKYSYSNTGYSLLGLIVERVTRMSWAEYLTENVLKKAGLLNTEYDQPVRVVTERAAGYQGDGMRPRNGDYIDMSLPHAAGGLSSTVEDFQKWLEALEEGKVISQASLERMMTRGLGNYGYGVNRGRVAGAELYSHQGGIHGFSTYFARYPVPGVSIMVFSNLQEAPVYAMAGKLNELLFGGNPVPALVRAITPWEAGEMAGAAGRYRAEDGTEVRIALEDDGLVMADSRMAGLVLPLYGQAVDTLYARVHPVRLLVTKEGGKVTRIQYRVGSEEMSMARVE